LPKLFSLTSSGYFRRQALFAEDWLFSPTSFFSLTSGYFRRLAIFAVKLFSLTTLALDFEQRGHI